MSEMCENLYYTIAEDDRDGINQVMNHEFILKSTNATYAKNKIIEESGDEYIESELSSYSCLTLKQLIMICDYYGITPYIRITRSKKEDIVNMLVLYENTDENYEIVMKRKRMWGYLEELKNDAYMKKFIIK